MRASRHIFFLAAAIFFVACSEKSFHENGGEEGEKTAVLHTFKDMDRSPVTPGSHIGYELGSVLQPIHRYSQTLENGKLTLGSGIPANQRYASYPRVKRLADGRYMLVYHGGLESGQWSRIWYVFGDDFNNWGTPQLLFEPYYTQVDGESPAIRFANPEILQTSNGDIYVVCAQRCVGFRTVEGKNGVVYKKSSDGGKTWSDTKMCWNQQNWEPYMLELPDGRIQCYFTDSDALTHNSGTGLVESFDGGKTWSGRKKVSRQYKYDYRTSDPDHVQYNGERIYTDQMPVFKLLADGHTLCGFLECRLEDPWPQDCNDESSWNSFVDMSLVYNDGFDWTALEGDAVGPERRKTNLFHKAGGGYIAVFPSGEVVLSCSSGKNQHLRMADAAADKYFGNKNWTRGDINSFTFPFPGVQCRWPMAETAGSNLLMSACCADEDGIHLAMHYLNQRQKAVRQEVSLDGNLQEWSGDKGWFMSDTLGAEVFLRFATDGRNLFIAADFADESRRADVRISLVKQGSGASAARSIILCPLGLLDSSAAGAKAAACEAESSDGAKGWTAEASIPLSELGVTQGDVLSVYPLLRNLGTYTAISFANGSDPSSWQHLAL